MTTLDKIKKLQAKLAKEFKNLDQERANLTFKCACSKYHKIKDCEVIQTHYLDRDQWWMPGELQIVCPSKKIRNRLLYNSEYEVEWKNRGSYDYSAEKQFNDKYKDLFKKVIEEKEEKTPEPWQNNYYIDENHEKFGIKIQK